MGIKKDIFLRVVFVVSILEVINGMLKYNTMGKRW